MATTRLPALLGLAVVLGAGSSSAVQRPHPYDYAPRWSPDGRHLAFERDDDLFVMDDDGRNAVGFGDGGWGADWSTDGRLVFARREVDGIHIQTWAQPRNGLRRLTSGATRDTNPHWSPDNRTIVFERRRNGASDVWRMRADGTSQVRLTTDGRSFLGIYPQPWAPDGRMIAFVSCAGRKCRKRLNDIFVMDAFGGDRRRLTWSYDNNSPSWSPDGTRIAYFNATDTDLEHTSSAELYVIRPDGSGRTNVSRSRARELQLSGNGTRMSWSPDGRRIVFDADSNGLLEGSSELWVVGRDGTRGRPLLRGAQRLRASDHVPEWSSDGRRIAFARLHAGAREGELFGSIHTARADGTHLRRLTY